jgi:hypothetical protein
MTFTARTFARDKNGELLKFEANEVESCDQAIAMVKKLPAQIAPYAWSTKTQK